MGCGTTDMHYSPNSYVNNIYTFPVRLRDNTSAKRKPEAVMHT